MKNTDIVNADEGMEIEVLPETTISNRRKNPYHCVFAEAIVHLSTAYVRFKGADKWTRYRVRAPLRKQIVSFDRHGTFDEGMYWLSAIQPSHRAMGKRQGGATYKKTGEPKWRKTRAYLMDVRAPARISSL
jgi:hypothetical protein